MHTVSKRQSDARSRVGELACLPVFFTLQDKRVILIGGSDAAAWKAELLLAAGAMLDVYCPADALDRDMLALMERKGTKGHMYHHCTDWREVDCVGAVLAIADLEAEDAPEFVAMGRAAAVPVNVIDKPAFCDFQFGAIVNRSPVVIGISTAGAAPILGQAVRRRVEAVLPKSLGKWGRLAATMRASVMARLRAGAQRRRFWEAFAGRAFGLTPWFGSVQADDLLNAVESDGAALGGGLCIVGAGPGDPELLTLKAMRVLQAADHIFYEKSVGMEILELARREAYREVVKADDGDLSEALYTHMRALVRSGKNVVLVQCGDVRVGAAKGDADVLVVPGVQIWGVGTGVPSAGRLLPDNAQLDGDELARHSC